MAKATRAEIARLDKILSGEWGAPLTRLSKRGQRRVLDILGDNNKSRNRIRDAELEIKRLTAERLRIRRQRNTPLSREQVRSKLARRLVKYWGTYNDGDTKTTYRVVYGNLQLASTEEMRDLLKDNNIGKVAEYVRDSSKEEDYEGIMMINPYWYHSGTVQI